MQASLESAEPARTTRRCGRRASEDAARPRSRPGKAPATPTIFARRRSENLPLAAGRRLSAELAGQPRRRKLAWPAAAERRLDALLDVGAGRLEVENQIRCRAERRRTSEDVSDDVKSEASDDSKVERDFESDRFKRRHLRRHLQPGASVKLQSSKARPATQATEIELASLELRSSSDTAAPRRAPDSRQSKRDETHSSSLQNKACNFERQQGSGASCLRNHRREDHYGVESQAIKTKTCCSCCRPETGTNLTMEMSCGQLAEVAGDVQCIGQESLTVSVSEMQEQQRKNVIISMALKSLVADKQEAQGGHGAGDSLSSCDLESGGCACGSASCLSEKSSDPSETSTTTSSETMLIRSPVLVAATNRKPPDQKGDETSESEAQDDKRQEPSGENESKSEQQNKPGEGRKSSTADDPRSLVSSLVRHLTQSNILGAAVGLKGRLSPLQADRPSAERPRSSLMGGQLDKLSLPSATSGANETSELLKGPNFVRRSCSAFGNRSHINCDTLSQAAVRQCDTSIEALIVESWLDDHPTFCHDYFIRKASRQLVDEWLVANVRLSNSNLRESRSDLCSPDGSVAMSRPVSQLSLGSGAHHVRGPVWMGSANMMTYEQDRAASNHPRLPGNFVRVNRSNSQSAASALAAAATGRGPGSSTPIRKISATDFETRSGSGFLRPMLSKTPDGRYSFLPQTSQAEQAQRQEHLSPRGSADGHQSGASPRSPLSQVARLGGGRLHNPAELMTSSSASSNTSTIQASELQANEGHAAAVERLAALDHTAADHDDGGRAGGQRRESDDLEAPDADEVKMIFELVRNIYDDLDIRTLLHKILKNIAALIHADRSSLFLVCGGPNDPNRRLVSQLFNVDQDSNELGESDEAITIPWGTGLVGYVAASGEAVNIKNCYEDPRFTDAIDQRTGYVTRHMLCAPILDKRNEIVGVAQVINKRDGNAFSENDEIKFKRYLQFCGIGLRNAQSYEQCQLENRRNQVLLDLARMVFEEQSTIEQVVHRIMLHTQSLLDCERCQVLLTDSGDDELESMLQVPSKLNSFQCNSNGGGPNNNNNTNNNNNAPEARRQLDWRPQCRLKDDTDASRPSSCDNDDDLSSDLDEHSCQRRKSFQQQQQQQQPHQQQSCQAPKLFSLVFDLECDGNDDPVVYDRRADEITLAGAPTTSGLRRARAFPINIGITGYVANTGETLNIENAHEHERFDASVDEGSDFRHRSILCMPIRNGQRQIIGVIQLINKKNGQPFNKNDEDLFEAFAIFCGLGIHNTLMYERVLKVMAKQRVTFEVLSYHATAPLEEAKKLSQEQVPSCFALDLSSLKFNDFSLDDQYMLKSCLRFFLDLDLIRRFQIDQLVFCNWILSVQKNYRKVTYHPIVGGNGLKASPVRYHNWRHAFNVSQMMFAILMNTQICRSLGELETLALLIACLCHDLDHRGTNNSFQIKSASPLAELYSTSTMEHHHFDQCVMILNSQGNQILSNLSPREYSRVIMLLEEAILATDLANYFSKRDHFFQLTNSDSLNWRNDSSHRSLLRCMLMTACDIAAITKPWPVQKVVADLVMSEFYQQGDIERNELKIEPSDMMNRDKMSELPSMQIGFIDSICAPIYSAFAKLFPQHLHPLIDGCLENRTIWRELAESNTKPKSLLPNYLSCDSNVPTKNNECANKPLPNNVNFSKSEVSLPNQLEEVFKVQKEVDERPKKVEISATHTSPSIIERIVNTEATTTQTSTPKNEDQRKSI